jgi:hypothetical protein
VLAGAVAQLKTENPNTLFVSAGDNIGASTFTSFSQQDEPTIDALLAAGLDASVVGNHEFDAAQGEHIVGLSLNGVAISPAAVFRVTTISFLAAGGDKFTTFAAGINATDTGQADLTATVSYFEQHVLVDPAPLGRAVLAGTDWASVTVGDAMFTPGERVTVTVSGLNPGQKITGTLYSTPVNLGTFAANAAGIATFSAVIPINTPVGAHDASAVVPGASVCDRRGVSHRRERLERAWRLERVGLGGLGHLAYRPVEGAAHRDDAGTPGTRTTRGRKQGAMWCARQIVQLHGRHTTGPDQIGQNAHGIA